MYRVNHKGMKEEEGRNEGRSCTAALTTEAGGGRYLTPWEVKMQARTELWNLADHDTRFLLATRISNRREVTDARAVFKDAKKLMSKRPLAVVHDGLQSYNEAFNKEFRTI